MSSARVIAGDDLSSAFEDLQAFDIASIENDQDARFRALSLARKVSAALESPLDRAVDLVFRVRSVKSRMPASVVDFASLTYLLRLVLR